MSDGPVTRVELAVPAALVDALAGRLWVEVPDVLGVHEPVDDGPLAVFIPPSRLDDVLGVARAVLGDDVAVVALPELDLPVEVRVDSVDLGGAAGTIELELDAQRVFGVGDHPTTRLALDALATLVRPGMRVLDVGTGSGVLAVAALRFGAASVVATDVDPLAVATAQRNGARNGVGDRLEVIESSDVPVGRGPFDVVVANISAATITAMASELDAMAPPGGLVLTGVLDRQASTVTEAFGRPLVVTASRDGWSLLQG